MKLLGTFKFQRDDQKMSFWTLETKADIGICGYSNSLPNLFKELTIGMMHLLIPEHQTKLLNSIPRHTAQWNATVNNSESDNELLILVWLEEVLFKLEVENKFLVDAQLLIKQVAGDLSCNAQVSWVDADLVLRDLEIKAVTSHELQISELVSGEVYISPDITIPELHGPLGLEMLFLIFSGSSKGGRSLWSNPHTFPSATPQHPYPQ